MPNLSQFKTKEEYNKWQHDYYLKNRERLKEYKRNYMKKLRTGLIVPRNVKKKCGLCQDFISGIICGIRIGGKYYRVDRGCYEWILSRKWAVDKSTIDTLS